MDFKHDLPRRKDGTFKKWKKHKKDKKKHSELGAVPKNPNLWDRFNQAETKGNINNSLMKTLGDFVAGGIIGPFLGAALGKTAPLAGMALSFGGALPGRSFGLYAYCRGECNGSWDRQRQGISGTPGIHGKRSHEKLFR